MQSYSRPLGDAVKRARAELGFTQNQVAEAADIDVRTVLNIENYKGNPKMEVLFPLVRVLKMDSREIFYPEMRRESPAIRRLRFLIEECSEEEAEALAPAIESSLHLQIQQLCQFAGERIAPLLVAVPHFPDSFKIGHLTDDTGHFLQPGPCTAMMAAVTRDNLIALAVFFRADGGGGHNAMFLDRPHQIVHRLIVLHLVGVLPERMERMKLRHFQVDDFSLFHRAGPPHGPPCQP